MNKKILTLILLCFSFMAGLFLTACGVNEIKTVTVIGNAYSEFVQGDTLDYGNIKIEVTFEDGTTRQISGKDEGVEIKNLSSDKTGNQSMTITYSDGKSSATCSIGYYVYTQNQTVFNQNDLLKVTGQSFNDDQGILFFKNSGFYDLSDIKINRNLTFIGKNGENVVLKDVYINQNESKSDIDVTFRNVTLSNNDGASGYILACDTSSVKVNNSNIYYGCNLTIEKCKVIANGKIQGILLPTKGDVVITESTFETPNDEDIFAQYLFKSNNTRPATSKFIAKRNTIMCKFSYLFGATYNLELEGNTIVATLRSTGLGATWESMKSQTNYVDKKNPVIIHMDLPKNPGENDKYYLICKNNTIKDAQNFIRIYNLDKYEVGNNVTFDISGNTYNNIAVLVNASTNSYAHLPQLLKIVNTDVTKDANKEISISYKAVIEKDTVIDVGQNGLPVIERATTGASIYYNFEDAEADYATMSVADGVDYIYVGKATAMKSDDGITSGYILKSMDKDEFIIISVLNYSPKGDRLFYVAPSGITENYKDAKVYTLAEIKDMLDY